MNLFYLLGLAAKHPKWAFFLLVLLGLLLTKLNLLWLSNRRSGDSDAPRISSPFTFVFHLFAAALFVGTFTGALDKKAFSSNNPLFYSIDSWLLMGPCLLMNLLGKLDDKYDLASRTKFFCVALIWLILLAIAIVRNLDSELLYQELFILSVSFGIGFLITVALPLLDGINGLFAALSAIFLFPLMYGSGCSHCCSSILDYFVICLNVGEFAMLLVPFLLGFLILNIKGKVRLGEAAVLPISFLIAHFNVTRLGYIHNSDFTLMLMFTLIQLFYPLTDAFLVMVNRIRNGRSPFAAGNDHLHHRLTQSGLSNMKCLIAIVTGLLIPNVTFFVVTRSDYQNIPRVLTSVAIGTLPMAFLFFLGYTKVNPYKSGAVERGRP